MPGVIAEEVTCGTLINFNINTLYNFLKGMYCSWNVMFPIWKSLETVDNYHWSKAERQMTSEDRACDE